jgi:hypothetical protein
MANEEYYSMNHLDIAMMDNSMKPWMSYENIDAIVMAGTPECLTWVDIPALETLWEGTRHVAIPEMMGCTR